MGSLKHYYISLSPHIACASAIKLYFVKQNVFQNYTSPKQQIQLQESFYFLFFAKTDLGPCDGPPQANLH